MLALILGAVAHRLVVQRGIIIESARTNLYRIDMLFVEQTGRAIEGVDLVLRDLAEQQSRPVEARPNFRMPLGERMARRIEGMGQIAGIEVLDVDGQVVASAPLQPQPVPASLLTARQEMMQRLRGGPVEAVQFGSPFKLDDDNWSVLLARRIAGPDGGFGGVVVACLNLAFFEAFYNSVELPDDGAVTLHRRDGIVLAAAPRRPGVIGSDTSTFAPFRMLQANGIEASGVIERVSDGSERIMAVRAHKTLPLVITVTTSLESTLREWQRRGLLLISGGVPVAALVWGLLSYGARQTKRIEELLGENRQARDAAIEANINLRAQIEERERTEAALQQAQRLEAIGQLTGGVAHDFNNLLTVLLGNIDLMQARVPGERRAPDPAITARLDRMRAAAEKGATLTDQLLAFARRQPLHPKPASINDVITAMTDLLQSAIGSNIRLETELGADVWAVLVDTTQIELVILNLALNARDAMPKGGMLTLRTENITISNGSATVDLPQGDYVAVHVIDNGTGMSEAVRLRAFEPFFTTKGPAWALGLACPRSMAWRGNPADRRGSKAGSAPGRR